MFIYALCRQANFGNAKILRAPITPIGPQGMHDMTILNMWNQTYTILLNASTCSWNIEITCFFFFKIAGIANAVQCYFLLWGHYWCHNLMFTIVSNFNNLQSLEDA